MGRDMETSFPRKHAPDVAYQIKGLILTCKDYKYINKFFF